MPAKMVPSNYFSKDAKEILVLGDEEDFKGQRRDIFCIYVSKIWEDLMTYVVMVLSDHKYNFSRYTLHEYLTMIKDTKFLQHLSPDANH